MCTSRMRLSNGDSNLHNHYRLIKLSVRQFVTGNQTSKALTVGYRPNHSDSTFIYFLFVFWLVSNQVFVCLPPLPFYPTSFLRAGDCTHYVHQMCKIQCIRLVMLHYCPMAISDRTSSCITWNIIRFAEQFDIIILINKMWY